MSAQPVVVTTGEVPIEGRPALPVYVDATVPQGGGPARNVVVVTSGPLAGGPPQPVYLAPAGVPGTGPALPVYVVSGSLGGASGPPVLVNVSPASTAAAGTSLQVNVPAGVQNGDLMIFGIAIRGGTGVTNLTLNGWNAFSFTPTNQSTNVQFGAWWRIASSEPASYTASWTGSNNAAAGIYAARGASAVDISGAQANTSNANVTAPSVVTTVANTLLIFIGGMSAGVTFTADAAMVERIDKASTAGATNCAIQFADQTLTSAGATGTRVAVATAAGGNVGALIALR